LKEIDDQLRINLSTLRDSNTDNEKKRLLPITYIEAILASIPNIIQANIENPVAGGLFDNILKDNPEIFLKIIQNRERHKQRGKMEHLGKSSKYIFL